VSILDTDLKLRRVLLRPLIIFAALFVITVNVHGQCDLDQSELTWLEGTIRVWKAVRSQSLHLPELKLPSLIVFNDKCVLNIDPDLKFLTQTGVKPEMMTLSDETVTVTRSLHYGKITLPDKKVIPAQLISFAADYNNHKSSFFVAALPSIWEKAEHLKAEKNVATLVRAVYVHELTHTYHRNFFARLDAVEKDLTGVDNFDDDIIQNTFGKDERFRQAYINEIALANAAADEPSLKKKKTAVKQLLSTIKKRRADFYIGENKKFEEIEDIFLTMEGVANWAGYQAAIADGLSPKDASRLIRRGGKYWSQEEGILLFMIIDPLLPKWQRIAFGRQRVSILDLLERAVR